MTTPFTPYPRPELRPDYRRPPFEQRYWFIWPVAGFIAGAMFVMVLTPSGGTVATTRTTTPTPRATTYDTRPPTYRTTAPTYTYTQTYRPTPTPSPTLTAGRIPPGAYRVGTDIESGTYRVRLSAGDWCYWERLSDLSGTLDGIIANKNVREGQAMVTIASTDFAFNSRGCGTWEKVAR